MKSLPEESFWNLLLLRPHDIRARGAAAQDDEDDEDNCEVVDDVPSSSLHQLMSQYDTSDDEDLDTNCNSSEERVSNAREPSSQEEVPPYSLLSRMINHLEPMEKQRDERRFAGLIWFSLQRRLSGIP